MLTFSVTLHMNNQVYSFCLGLLRYFICILSNFSDWEKNFNSSLISILFYFDNYIIVWINELCRWGNTPLDEGRRCGNKNLIKLLEDAKSAQLLEFPNGSQDTTGIAKNYWVTSIMLSRLLTTLLSITTTSQTSCSTTSFPSRVS